MERLAEFWGIELPTSFNYPFGQTNISEFWARWNMTVTRICRDYLFYNRWGFKESKRLSESNARVSRGGSMA